MRPIVSARNLSKRYYIGRARNSSPTLREAVVEAFNAPLERLRQGRPVAADPLWVLKDVNFDVAPGEVVGIIGRNGAGKSTLLKILARIVKPSTGEVDIYGRVGSLLEVGTGFHPDLSGRENIFLNGTILGMKRQEIKQKFDEIVAFAEVSQFLDTAVKYYSSGMYLRLAFAIAAHLEPEILLLDEVLAVGDAAFQKKCLDKMKAVSRDGRTIFFVSHNMEPVRRLCGRVFLISGGRLHEEDKPEIVVSKYLADCAQNPERVARVSGS
ncbi:MAG TPA: ABC transporter ATP-binding protein [Pyrinomonadaceae bacterium]|jgi:lipopolysaccharide transport system ATP-binding protein|nr:ABC transporter ATP-binding protein [Pyrinomonadaceae bacterium]